MELTTNDGITVKGEEEEILRLMMALRDGLANSPQDPDLIAARRAKVKQAKSANGIKHNPDSPYYLKKRKRNFSAMADTYDYVAHYKNGRTYKQVAHHFSMSESSAYSRLRILINEGLMLAPDHRGGAYKAVPREEIVP